MSRAIDQYIESKEGLKDKCRSRWITMANAYYARCVNDGGTPDECDAKTIRKGKRVTNYLGKLVKVKRAKRLGKVVEKKRTKKSSKKVEVKNAMDSC